MMFTWENQNLISVLENLGAVPPSPAAHWTRIFHSPVIILWLLSLFLLLVVLFRWVRKKSLLFPSVVALVAVIFSSFFLSSFVSFLKTGYGPLEPPWPFVPRTDRYEVWVSFDIYNEDWEFRWPGFQIYGFEENGMGHLYLGQGLISIVDNQWRWSGGGSVWMHAWGPISYRVSGRRIEFSPTSGTLFLPIVGSDKVHRVHLLSGVINGDLANPFIFLRATLPNSMIVNMTVERGSLYINGYSYSLIFIASRTLTFKYVGGADNVFGKIGDEKVEFEKVGENWVLTKQFPNFLEPFRPFTFYIITEERTYKVEGVLGSTFDFVLNTGQFSITGLGKINWTSVKLEKKSERPVGANTIVNAIFTGSYMSAGQVWRVKCHINAFAPFPSLPPPSPPIENTLDLSWRLSSEPLKEGILVSLDARFRDGRYLPDGTVVSIERPVYARMAKVEADEWIALVPGQYIGSELRICVSVPRYAPYYISTTLRGREVGDAIITLFDAETGKKAEGSFLVSVSDGVKTLSATGNPVSFSGLGRRLSVSVRQVSSSRKYYPATAEAILDPWSLNEVNIFLEPVPSVENGTSSLFVRVSTDANSPVAIYFNGIKYPTVWNPSSACWELSLENLREGTYSLTAVASGYAGRSVTVELLPGKRSVVELVLERQDIPAPYGSLLVRVLDRATGRPVPGAFVILVGGNMTAVTDASGEALFSPLLPSTYGVLVVRDGYQGAVSKADVLPCAMNILEMRLVPFTPPPPGTAELLVRVKTDLYSPATVFLDGRQYGTRFNYDTGRWEVLISNLGVGTHSLAVHALWYEGRTMVINLPGGRTTVDITLSRLTGNGMLAVRVRDENTGLPVPEAIVSLGDVPLPISGGVPTTGRVPVLATQTTDRNGMAVFSNLHLTWYSLQVSKEGYIPQVRTVAVTGPVSVDILLRRCPPPPPGTAELLVRVETDANSPAVVSINGVEHATTWNPSAWRWELLKTGLGAGKYYLSAIARGYEGKSVEVSLATGERKTVDIRLNPITRPGYGSILVRVKDKSTSAPISGATVMLNNGRMGVTSGGEVVFQDLPEGDYVVTVFRDGYSAGSRKVSVSAGRTAVAEFLLEPVPPPKPGTATLRVRVKGPDEKSVVFVGVNGEVGRASWVGGRWEYVRTGLGAGKYSITASAKGFNSKTVEVILKEGKETVVDVELSPSPPPEVPKPEHGTLVVEVYDKRTGLPLPDVTVVLSNGEEGKTDAEGSVCFRGLPEGTYSVSIISQGYFDVTKKVSVKAGRTCYLKVGLGSYLFEVEAVTRIPTERILMAVFCIFLAAGVLLAWRH